ncbi:replication initiator [Nocardia sp. NPDC056000]|uniref:replication initiator n=1 Tax=Nocardia sp. NPDC056000 TaxID=3345674 RepID=UPI0035DA3E40
MSITAVVEGGLPGDDSAETAPGPSLTHETAAQRRARPSFLEIAEAAADNFGVCRRPIPMRVYDPRTGMAEYVGAPCKATFDSICPSCAARARSLRIQQCRDGWHLDEEPSTATNEITTEQIDLLETRARMVQDYQHAKRDGDTERIEAIRASVRGLDEQLRETGIRRGIPPLDPVSKKRRTRSTRRRQDAPDLPRRRVDQRTIGREYAGAFRPSMMVTFTMPSYGRVHRGGAVDRKGRSCGDGSPVDPKSYDYARAARDVVHFAALVDRLMQNLRRVVGWNVQYYAVVEPQRRGAPHVHVLIRGTIPREVIKQVAAATYHQVWWPHHDEEVYGAGRMPVWDASRNTFVDPDTGDRLPSWDEALDILDTVDDLEPAHVVRLGAQFDRQDIRGVLGGTEEAGRHISYVTKYLTKAISEILEAPNQRTADHYNRLHDELQRTPCCEQCPVWLRYGIVPQGVTGKTIPGRCRRKAHRRDMLGLPGRRVLNSRQWSGKTLPDYKIDRAEFVRQLLAKVGIVKPDTTHLKITPVEPGDTSVPPREHLIMAAVTKRSAWRIEYQDALANLGPPGAQHVSSTPEVSWKE